MLVGLPGRTLRSARERDPILDAGPEHAIRPSRDLRGSKTVGLSKRYGGAFLSF